MSEIINITDTKVLSDSKYTLKKVTFDYTKPDGCVESQTREVYDRGDGATILLYNQKSGKVILTKQLRVPTYLNGNQSGMMIETCAGMLDRDNPEDCIRREVEEETGYKIKAVEKVFEAYMSPGAVTEIIHFFIGAYADDMKVGTGGGLAEEHEHIEVLETDFGQAFQMIENGEIRDAKTIMLLQYAKLQNLFHR